MTVFTSRLATGPRHLAHEGDGAPARLPSQGRRSAGDGWLSALFPPAARSELPRPLLVLGYLAGFVALTALALLRQPGLSATRTFWAEDGVIFYTQAMARPVVQTLFSAYNGYNQLVPRLLVQLTRLGPLHDAAEIVAISGAAGLALLACTVFHMSRGHVPSPLLRGILSLAMVLLPIASVEMLNNLVNLPWWMFFAAFWALLWRPSTVAGRWAAGALCALAAASEPLVGLLLPLAIVRMFAFRGYFRGAAANEPAENASTAGFLIGIAYQAGVVLAAKGQQSFPHAGLSGAASNFGARVGLGWLTGLRWSDQLLAWSRPASEIVGVALFVATAIACVLVGSREAKVFTVVAAVFAPLLYGFPVWLRGVGHLLDTNTSVGFAGRYSAVPILLVVSMVLVTASRGTAMDGRRHAIARHLAIAGVCCAILAPQWAADFRDTNGRSAGPAWDSQVADAARQCLGQAPRTLVLLHIDPPGAGVVLHCDQVVRGAREAASAY